MSDSRPPAYFEGDTLVIRASSLGGPVCQLVAAGQGHEIMPPPPWLQKAFDEGNRWEGPMLEELRRRGWREPKLGHVFNGAEWPGDTPAAQSEHDWPVVPGIVVRFHPDDVLVPVGDDVPATRERASNFPEGPVLVECKALSAANYEMATTVGAARLPYAYDWQLSAMMHGLGLPAVWVTVDKGASKAYEASDPDGGSDQVREDLVLATLHAEWVATPPIPKADIVRRVLKIRQLIRSGDLPTDGADHQANPCRFLHVCPVAEEREATVVATGDRATEVARWAQWYEQQKTIEKQAGERKAEARERLLELVGEDDAVLADGWKVTRTEVASSRVDRRAIEKDNGGTVPEKWLKESVSVRLEVEGAGS